MTTIYHNPRCSKSRQTLQLLRERGIEPEVVAYLETPPDAKTLAAIIKKLGVAPRELLRKGETEYKEANLANPDLSDADIINAMVEHPKLMERPIVIHGNKAVLGRPPEAVLDIL